MSNQNSENPSSEGAAFAAPPPWVNSLPETIPPKPAYRFQDLPDLPAFQRLGSLGQWLIWDYRWNGKRNKWDKVPCHWQTGRVCSATSPDNWTSLENAKAAAIEKQFTGIGFALSTDDNLTGIDLDNCIDPESGCLEPWAQDVIKSGDTYAEISPSGKGIRMFAEGKIDRALKCDEAGIEMYATGRYLTITGQHIEGTNTAITPARGALVLLLPRIDAFKEDKKKRKPPLTTSKLDARQKQNEQKAETGFFRQVNEKALQHLGKLAPAIFGDKAEYQPATGAWRINSASLDRSLEEDISLHPDGIHDFGEEEGLSAIDLVMRWTDQSTPKAAALWICDAIEVDPLALGYRAPRASHGDNDIKLKSASGLSLDDFYAYMPMHKYIHRPSREIWPSGSVNARLPGIPIQGGGEIPPTTYLDRNRAVEQMSWAPGEPELIPNRLISDGGWIDHKGSNIYNLYRASRAQFGDPAQAQRWLDHVTRIYPEEAEHIIQWLAHRVQHPDIKINHALVLGGTQGIGKDTLLEPVKYAVGPWNFAEVSPKQMLGRFNGFLKSVILRISEGRDLGDIDRYAFYDACKTFIASPPDVLRVDEKHLREYSIPNVTGIILTTNYKSGGLYLPSDDRRHFVAWSERTKEDFDDVYWQELWDWFESGGKSHVAAYLTSTAAIGQFKPKAPPPKTAAFHDIADSNRAPEDAELSDTLDRLGSPVAVTLDDLRSRADGDLAEWLSDRKNRRQIPHRMETAGYSAIRNPSDLRDGHWKVGGKRQTIYVKVSLSTEERLKAASQLAKSREPCR